MCLKYSSVLEWVINFNEAFSSYSNFKPNHADDDRGNGIETRPFHYLLQVPVPRKVNMLCLEGVKDCRVSPI